MTRLTNQTNIEGNIEGNFFPLYKNYQLDIIKRTNKGFKERPMKGPEDEKQRLVGYRKNYCKMRENRVISQIKTDW